jgi:hypothetical protein
VAARWRLAASCLREARAGRGVSTVTYPVLDVTTAAASAKGPAGQIELVTCKQVTVTVRHKRVKRTKCTTRLVSKNVRFTTATASAASASITRGRAVYARGRLISTRHGATKLMLAPARTLNRAATRS